MINGEEVLREKYAGLDDKQYQPAGVDLRLGKVMILDESEEVYGISGNVKQLPDHKLVPETAVTIKSSTLGSPVIL